jgi:hypothetical protein
MKHGFPFISSKQNKKFTSLLADFNTEGRRHFYATLTSLLPP